MLQFINIHHQFGANILFEDLSWHIKPGNKIALIGPNGSGKTTLFQFATGKLLPEKGTVVRSKGTKISLFQQIPQFFPDKNVIETVLNSNYLYSEYIQKKSQLDLEWENCDHNSPSYDKLLEVQSELEDFAYTNDLHSLETKARIVLSGLGFSGDQFYNPMKSFSPGYHHRVGLAIALLNPHNLLLLDEPTNHLDDISKDWLADYLQNTKTTFVLVTHDPEFLNQTTDMIAEISSHGVIEFKGSLDTFLEEKNEMHEKLQVQFQKEETYLKKRMDWINRFRAQATKAKQVQSALKKLEKREKVENPEDIFWNKKPDYQFNFFPSGKLILKVENGAFQYPGANKFVFKSSDLEISLGDKIALVGPNGAGKSTFLKCLQGIYKFTTGSFSFGPKTRTNYFSQTHSEDINLEQNALQIVMSKFPDTKEQEARSLLGFFSFSGDAIYKTVKNMSGGEQSRLRLALLVLSPSNCLFMDEPTNHLDMVTRDALKRAIANFEGSALIISHDPDFLKGLCNKTYQLAEGELKNLNCSFTEFLELYKENSASEKRDSKIKGIDNRSSQNPDKKRIKKLEKELAIVEQKISGLESEKSSLEQQMANPEFYKSLESKEKLNRYESVKSEINQNMQLWEEYTMEIEELQKLVMS